MRVGGLEIWTGTRRQRRLTRLMDFKYVSIDRSVCGCNHTVVRIRLAVHQKRELSPTVSIGSGHRTRYNSVGQTPLSLRICPREFKGRGERQRGTDRDRDSDLATERQHLLQLQNGMDGFRRRYRRQCDQKTTSSCGGVMQKCSQSLAVLNLPKQSADSTR
ncbi:hypothetical protein BaRGS_00001594 [Batillaria attramentaria]|uniref:Uncharacterized protein n=1 Tax=Batillaria attramentaria TaxID=370345 RepID=A0ABD0M793_9CAEN